MRLFNKTKFDDDFLIDFVKPHYFKAKEMVKDSNQFIESIEVRDTNQNTFKITIFGIDCVILETESNQNHTVKGKVRCFDESSGEGVIRLKGGQSIHFYSCNVEGANSSLYPEMVSNIQLRENQDVEATLSGDPHTVKALGLIDVKIIKNDLF